MQLLINLTIYVMSILARIGKLWRLAGLVGRFARIDSRFEEKKFFGESTFQPENE